MGLDNYPKHYPCQSDGTAVMADLDIGDGRTVQQIDCAATMACDGCPWKKALGDLPGAVRGILGTPCWYRGKIGQRLLHSLGVPNDVSFYGDSDDQTVKSAASCRRTADAIELAITDEHGLDLGSDERVEARYAMEWLRWVADTTDGCHAWH